MARIENNLALYENIIPKELEIGKSYEIVIPEAVIYNCMPEKTTLWAKKENK